MRLCVPAACAEGRARRAGIANSYTLGSTSPLETVRVRSWLEGLEAEGFRPGGDVELLVVDSNDLGEIEDGIRWFVEEGVDLIHAVGTPNAALALSMTRDVPIVYYGAHPQGVGLEECTGPNVCGVHLALPFTSHYKSFRFLRKLLPGIRSLYVPFYEGTIFCHPQMRERYAEWVRRHGRTWIPSDSGFIGYPGLAGLCEIIDVEYREFPLGSSAELPGALDAAAPRAGGAVMTYNDVFYCTGAPRALIQGCLDRGVPLLWNNNAEAAREGALAGIEGCWREAGGITGRMAGRVLAGEHPSRIGVVRATRSYSAVNLETAARLGLELSDDTLAYFDEVVGAAASRAAGE